MSELNEKTTVKGGEREFEVSTVKLPLKHGQYWYETCLFWDDGSYVLDRYKTESDAVDGHWRTVDSIASGNFNVETKEHMTAIEIL